MNRPEDALRREESTRTQEVLMAKNSRQHAPRDRKRGLSFPRPPCSPKPPGPPPPVRPSAPECETGPDPREALKKLLKEKRK